MFNTETLNSISRYHRISLGHIYESWVVYIVSNFWSMCSVNISHNIMNTPHTSLNPSVSKAEIFDCPLLRRYEGSRNILNSDKANTR